MGEVDENLLWNGGDLHDHLLSGEESVCDEFSGSDSDWLVTGRSGHVGDICVFDYSAK
jgi:hypothetical protein